MFGDVVELKPDENIDLNELISLENNQTLLKVFDDTLGKFGLSWNQVSLMTADGGGAGQLCIKVVSFALDNKV